MYSVAEYFFVTLAGYFAPSLFHYTSELCDFTRFISLGKVVCYFHVLSISNLILGKFVTPQVSYSYSKTICIALWGLFADTIIATFLPQLVSLWQ